MRKKIIVVSLIFILFVISIISFFLLNQGTTNHDKEKVDLKITIPLCLLIAGENYQFEITNIPDDALVVWDLGDGSETSAIKPLIGYQYAGKYNFSTSLTF